MAGLWGCAERCLVGRVNWIGDFTDAAEEEGEG